MPPLVCPHRRRPTARGGARWYNVDGIGELAITLRVRRRSHTFEDMSRKYRLGITAVVLGVAVIDAAVGDYRSALVLAVMAGLIYVVAGVNAVLSRRFGPAVQMGWSAVFLGGWAALLWVLVLTTDGLRVLGLVGALMMTALASVAAFVTFKAARDPNAAERMQQAREAR
jgi:apolipoprotein N-acyltransferase